MNVNARLARTEVWDASEQYDARYMLHLVLENGEFLSLSTTPALLEIAAKLQPLSPVVMELSIERTYKDGRVRLAAENLTPTKPAAQAA